MAHEAKQYAQRNRQGSDWFSHDGGAVKPASPAPVEPAAAASEVPAAADENNVDKSPSEEAAPAAAPLAPAPLSARAQMIRPKCDSNEWFVLSCRSCCADTVLLLTFQFHL